MAGFEVASSPVVMEESLGKDVMERKEGKPDRPRREPEEVPDMTVEEAHKALNALSKAEPQPDSEEHDQQVAAINEDIRKIKIQIEDLKTKIDKAQEGRQGQVDEMSEARETMRTLKLERDEIRAQLNSVQEVTKSAKATLEGHDKSKKALQSSLKYRTVEEIETAIKKMEIRQQTSSMALSDEKKLVKEIEHLKQSKKTAAQYVSHEEALGKAKDGYNATRKTESEKKAELKIVQDKIRATHTILEGMNKTREEEGAGVNMLYEEKKALHEEISEKIEKIKDIRKAHTARLDAWYDLRRERMKFKKAMQKAEWVERQAAKEARHKAIEDEEAKKIPFESEMVLCDNLVTYLETTFLKGEAAKPAAAAAPLPTGAAASAEFGGVKMVMKKRHEEDFIMGGGRRKSGGRKKAGGKNAPAARNTIVHAMDTMESFAMLSISPPPSKAAVPDAIKALKDKKAWFKEQPRPTPGKPTQSGDKVVKKQAAKEKIKPPDINDAEFPGLPGMVIKPKQEDPLTVPGATENSGEEGDADGDIHEGAISDEKASEAEAPQSAASVVANGIHGKANGVEKNADDGNTATSAGQAEIKENEDQQDGLEGEVDPTDIEKVEDCVQRGPEDGEDAPKADMSGKEGDQVDAGEVVEGSAGTKDGDEE